MDREALQATAHGVTKSGHHQVTNTLYDINYTVFEIFFVCLILFF